MEGQSTLIPLAIRLGRASDVPYVVDSWVKRGHDKGERISEATARVRAVLARPATVLRVACLPDDDDAILGWAAVSFVPAAELHYVYVRKDARNQGVARRLLVGIDWPSENTTGHNV